MDYSTRRPKQAEKVLEECYGQRVVLWAIGETKNMPEGILRKDDDSHCVVETEEGRKRYLISDLIGLIKVND